MDGYSFAKQANGFDQDDASSDDYCYKEKEEKPVVGFFTMYRFALPLDKVLLCLAVVCALLNGAALPAISLAIGVSVDAFVNVDRLGLLLDAIPGYLAQVNLTRADVFDTPSKLQPQCLGIDVYRNTSGSCDDLDLKDSLEEAIQHGIKYYIIVGSTVLFAAMGQVALFHITSERQANRIRRFYMANILRQDIGWFETHDAAELNSQLSGDIVKIQSGIGDKAGSTVQYVARFMTGYLIGFINGWQLALVLMALSPMLIAAAGLMAYSYMESASRDQKAYARAGGIAEEVLSSIRTVWAFGGEWKEFDRYRKYLRDAQVSGNKKGLITGIALGFSILVTFCTYGLGLWYGGKLLREDEYRVKDIITVFLAVSTGTFAIGTSFSGLQGLQEGRGAAYNVFQLIDMKPGLDSSSPKGERPVRVQGSIHFKGVHFFYPARLGVKILSGFELRVEPGQTVAVVGSSGSGKSTLVQLLLRFYEPGQGRILLDGHDIKDLNIKWLRQSIGLVSQEPVLFDTSIAENIRYGREGVTEAEILQATKQANAYDFISKLPEQLNTQVGEGGAQLSGGQKQRIAIARALVRNPKILLLDEATSALDNESEAVVQDALDKARQGRTTLVIAHRLSTIKTADIIIGLEAGRVKEKGTHSQLMEREGIYYNLVTDQTREHHSAEEFDEKYDEVKEHKRPWMNGEVKRDGSRPLSKIADYKVKDLNDEELPGFSTLALLRLNSPEWLQLLLGFLGAVICGGAEPVFSIFLSEILNIYSKEDDEQKRELRKDSLLLCAVGVVSFCGAVLQNWMFALAGEALTRRLRERTFQAMLKQEMAWFDNPYNSTGALTDRLATDVALVQEAGGMRLGILLQCLVGVVSALILTFYYSWQLTLVALGFFPLIMMAGTTQAKVIRGNATVTKDALEGASMVAVEAIQNMKTVAALTLESTMYDVYCQRIGKLLDHLYRNAITTGMLFSVSQAVMYYSIGANAMAGAYLVHKGDVDPIDAFRVNNLLIFCGVFLGQAVTFAPDINRAKAATRRIFYTLERQPQIDVDARGGAKLHEKFFNSSITVQQAHFRYPVRPDVRVLQNLSFKVKPGQTVALVGSSGCGKSTIVALLERFYNLDSGSMSIQGHDISQLNIRWLRSQLGLVSQEPVLFDCSIADNIAYGDNARVVPMEEIIQAARQANVHDFVQALPAGYDTNVGEKGTQLSGGQKQRIAIARALVRNPPILLLDEATSALDTENEKVVQEALDKARRGRTCIVIAHRLSTIQDADNIVVIRAGEVMEQGTHQQLMDSKGFYYKLKNIQTRQKDSY